MDQYYSRVCGYKLSFEPWNDKFDQRTYLKYCNGAETFYSYDPQRRRLQNLVVNAKAGTIMDNAYTYDAVSNVLSVKNGASVPQSGKAGGQMAHNYTYDALYRLVSATGTYTGADNKTASYTLAMGYDNMHRITSKRQILTQNNVQFNGTLNAGYDLSYTYGTETGKKFQLANVKDVNYRTEETPSESENVNNNHAYEYDANGNLVYVNTSRTKKDGMADEKTAERKLKWDEENRLLASDDNGFVTNYWYDADGERTVKTSGESDQVYVNSEFAGGRTNTAKFSLYVSPYLVANQGGRYTKHIYIGSQRVVSKIGDFDSYGSDPRRIQYAGSETDGLSVDYKVKYTQQLQAIKDNYATFAVPYNGEDNNDYVDGKGFCCNDGSLEAAQTRALARAAKNNFQEGDTYEKMQFYYHPDHLGSSSYITNLDGEVVQHIEYVPFGEVFVEERNNIWNTPYLFNAKEFDEETGLYYYGARYYEPRLSLWMSTDPMEEKYPATSSYCFEANNPIKYFDLDGLQLWVANNEAMSLLLHTLAPEDRGYVVRDKNEFIDSKILTEGVKHSVSNSENLKSLQKIVADPDNTVRLYGLVEQYDFLSVNNEKKTKIFEAPNRQNLYRELMEGFSGDESMKAKYSETLIQQGIVDEYELTGNLGATLRPKRLTNVFPAGQMSMSNDVEIYISCKGTTTLEQVKTLGHELYGHTLFGISGLDPRHGGNTGRPDGNPTLEKQIIKSEMESEKNYNQ